MGPRQSVPPPVGLILRSAYKRALWHGERYVRQRRAPADTDIESPEDAANMQDISHFTFHLHLSIGDPQTGKPETRRPLLRPSTAVLGALFLGLPNCALALSLDSYGRQASERLDSRRFDLQLSTRGQASPHHSLQPRFRPAVWGWDGTANPCAARDAAFVVLPPACSWSIGAAALGCFHACCGTPNAMGLLDGMESGKCSSVPLCIHASLQRCSEPLPWILCSNPGSLHCGLGCEKKQFKADQVIRTASRSSAGPLKLLGTRVERHSTDLLNTSVVVPVQLVR